MQHLDGRTEDQHLEEGLVVVFQIRPRQNHRFLLLLHSLLGLHTRPGLHIRLDRRSLLPEVHPAEDRSCLPGRRASRTVHHRTAAQRKKRLATGNTC